MRCNTASLSPYKPIEHRAHSRLGHRLVSHCQHPLSEIRSIMAHNDAHRSINRIVGYMLLVATPFLSVGLFASWWSASLWAEYASMKHWVEVPAIIKTTELEEHSARKSTRYEVFATYDYEYAKQRYSGSRVTLLSGLMNQGTFNRDAYKELKDHRVQQAPFRCYVNPNSPQESILYRDLPGFPLVQSTLLATVPGTIGMTLLVVAVGTLVSGSNLSRHNTEQSHSNNGKLRLSCILGNHRHLLELCFIAAGPEDRREHLQRRRPFGLASDCFSADRDSDTGACHLLSFCPLPP